MPAAAENSSHTVAASYTAWDKAVRGSKGPLNTRGAGYDGRAAVAKLDTDCPAAELTCTYLCTSTGAAVQAAVSCVGPASNDSVDRRGRFISTRTPTCSAPFTPRPPRRSRTVLHADCAVPAVHTSTADDDPYDTGIKASQQRSTQCGSDCSRRPRRRGRKTLRGRRATRPTLDAPLDAPRSNG